ncbi:MAG: EI24 domain-containing protein [Opitutales bacterium]|nr:EI24 domain-containing protein [Opitutales bacterium]
MINNYWLAIRQLGDRRLWKPVLWATLFSLLSLALLLIIGTSVAGWLFDSLFSYFDSYEEGSWIRIIAQSILVIFFIILGFFFFGSIHAAFLGLYIDDIINAVQEKYYPGIVLQPAPKLYSSILISIRLVALSAAVNLIAAPFFLFGWFFPPLGIALQLGVNGFLFGREYKITLKQRLPHEIFNQNQPFTSYGSLGAALMMVPLANLVAPLLICNSLFHAIMNNKNR